MAANAERTIFIARLPELFRLDAGGLDDRLPAFDFGFLLGGEGRRSLLLDREDFLADVLESLLGGWVRKRGLERAVQRRDDRRGRALRHPDAVPEAGVDALDAELVERRH